MSGGDPDGPHWIDLALARARRLGGIDHVDIRFEQQYDRRYVLRGRDPRTASRGYIGGIGIRIRRGTGRGYAYTNELARPAIEAAVDNAARLAAAAAHDAPAGPAPEAPRPRRIDERPPEESGVRDADAEAVHALLQRGLDALASERPDARATIAFGVKRTETILADDAGSWYDLGAATSTLYLQAVEKDGTRAGDSTAWRGGSLSLQDYESDGGPEAIGADAARRLEESMRARAVVPGRHRTLTDPNLSGLLAHESFGHLTESDLVRSGWSVLANRLGERLAAPGVSVHDDPIAPDPTTGVRVPYDHEGTPGKPVTILDDGVLRSYLHDHESAQEADRVGTGNARALNVHHPPIVRMRNTYIDRGEHTLEEVLEQLGDGYYLQGGRGGSPRADGSFMFTAERGYRVERGQIVEPVKMTSIYGNVLDFLANVEALTNELEIHTNYFGGCGKWDQSYLHVGTGGPHVLVSEALIGGQA